MNCIDLIVGIEEEGVVLSGPRIRPIYAKNDLNVVKIDIDIFDTESIWCKIVARKEEVVIGVSYNNPSSSDTCRNNLNNIVKNICSTYKNVILCGDFNFNYPCTNWNLLHASTPSSQLFLDTVLDCYGNLYPKVKII